MEKRVAVAEKARSESDEKLEKLRTEIEEIEERLRKKEEEFEKATADAAENSNLARERTDKVVEIKEEIAKIAARNAELEGENENVKLEIIKQKSDLTDKHVREREALIKVAEELEHSLENAKKMTEAAENRAAERLGHVGELESEVAKHAAVVEELHAKMTKATGLTRLI